MRGVMLAAALAAAPAAMAQQHEISATYTRHNLVVGGGFTLNFGVSER